MLLKNEVEANLRIKLTLTFDDGTVKSQYVQEGSILKLKYIKDKTKYEKTGVVKEINVFTYLGLDTDLNINCETLEVVPTILRTSDVKEVNSNSAFLLKMDFSKDFESDYEQILSCNILDIDLLQLDEKMELRNLYNESAQINNDEGQWTEDSYNHLQSILRIVKYTLDDPKFSKDDAPTALSILNEALLKLAPTEESEPVDPNPDESEEKKDNPSETEESDPVTDNGDENGDDADGSDDESAEKESGTTDI